MDGPLGDLLMLQPAKSVKTLRRLLTCGLAASLVTFAVAAPPRAWQLLHDAAAVNVLLAAWCSVVCVVTCASLPLRLGLLSALSSAHGSGGAPPCAPPPRQKLVEVLHAVVSSSSWRANKALGSVLHVMMMAGVALCALGAGSAAADAGVLRSVACGTATLVARTLVSTAYCSSVYLTQRESGEGQGKTAALRQAAMRGQLRLVAWASHPMVAEPTRAPACCAVRPPCEEGAAASSQSGARVDRASSCESDACSCGSTVACPICLEDLMAGESTARLPCPDVSVGGVPGHVFHEACILPWLARHARCPLCCHEMDEE